LDVIDQLEIILPTLNDHVGRVTIDQLDQPTPCAQYRVRDLFGHLVGGASSFGPQLRGEAPREAGDLADDELHGAVKLALEELLDAAKAPGASERTVTLPFGQVPGEVLIRFITVDGMVHTWDIAQATGQEYDPPEPLAEEVLETARALIAPEMRDGDTFAPETPVPDDAPAIVRLAAFTGRAV
jgi:uncharacterized protein (TIGR03086 family)